MAKGSRAGATVLANISRAGVMPICSAKSKKGELKITPCIFIYWLFKRKVLIIMQPIELPYKKDGRPSSNWSSKHVKLW